MHILICDDDAAFAAQMDEYISEWFRAREIQVQSTVCTSGEQLLATPELGHYQLAFLDVDLKTTDGIALGRQLRQVAPDIVLVYISAYLEFAPQGYTVNAYRYLLKRDIAAQLPSCLEDIFAGMTDPKKTLDVRSIRNYKVELRSGVELNASRQDFPAIRNAWLEWKGQFGDE